MRRKRRRQVDADAHPRRQLRRRRGRDRIARCAGALPQHARGACRRHPADPPGDFAGARDVGRRKHLPGQPSGAARRRRQAPAHAEAGQRNPGCRRPRLPPDRPARQGRTAVLRQPADGRDRARVGVQLLGRHLRRADRLAHPVGSALAVRDDRRPQGARRRRGLHLPQDVRGLRARRPHHGASRRPDAWHAEGGRHRPEANHPAHDRARPRAAGPQEGAAYRRGTAARREPACAALRARRELSTCAAARCSACAASSARAAPR